MKEFSSLLKIFIEEPNNNSIFRELFGQSIRRGPAVLDPHLFSTTSEIESMATSAFQLAGQSFGNHQNRIGSGETHENLGRLVDGFQALLDDFTMVACPFASSKEAKPVKRDFSVQVNSRGPYHSFWMRKIDILVHPTLDLAQVSSFGYYSRDAVVYGQNLKGAFLQDPQFKAAIELVSHVANNIHSEHCALL
jgi:hypothetical protein